MKKKKKDFSYSRFNLLSKPAISNQRNILSSLSQHTIYINKNSQSRQRQSYRLDI